MKQKFFTLLILSLFLSAVSFAQLFNYTVSGNLSNTNGLAVPVYYIDSLIATTLVDTTDANGDYQFNIVNGSGNVQLYFYNCQGNMVDTFMWVNSSGATWNASACDTLPPPCPVSYTTTYDANANTFYLEVDSVAFAGYNTTWDFGDGSTGTGLFVSHVYSVGNAIYNVCATINILGTMFPICSYCHNIGFDSLGNAVFKQEAQNFTIQVIQQGTLASVKEINAASSIHIFPNPAGNHASVVVDATSNSNCEIKITNMLGQEVKSLNTNAVTGINTYKFDLTELQSGNYFVTVKCGDTVLTKRFVK